LGVLFELTTQNINKLSFSEFYTKCMGILVYPNIHFSTSQWHNSSTNVLLLSQTITTEKIKQIFCFLTSVQVIMFCWMKEKWVGC